MARQGSSIGRENYENEEINVNGELMERPEDSVETQLVEVDNETRAADVLDIDEQQLADDTAQLEEHAEVVADSLEDGGMDETAARQTEIAVESIANRWNLKRAKLGRENFASGSSRMSASKLGLESILDTIKGAWERFYEWVVERFRAMKDVWRKYVNAGKKFKTRAQKLRDRIGKLEGSPESDDKVQVKKIWKLAGGDSVDTSTLKFEAEKFAEDAGKGIEISFDAADKSWTSSGSDLRSAIVHSDKLIPASTKLTLKGSESKFNKLLPADAVRENGKGHRLFAYPGGIAIVYKKSSQTGDRFNGVDGADKFKEADCLFYAQVKFEDILDQEAPVLTVDQMHGNIEKVIGAASTLEKYIEKYSNIERKMEKLQNNLKRAIEKEGKSGGDTADKQAKMKESSLRVEMARVNLNNAIQLDRLMQNTLRNFCEGSLTYVQESMRFYKD